MKSQRMALQALSFLEPVRIAFDNAEVALAMGRGKHPTVLELRVAHAAMIVAHYNITEVMGQLAEAVTVAEEEEKDAAKSERNPAG